MPDAPVDQLAQALDATERLVAAVRDDQWTLPTPCTDWTVRDLANHLIGGNRMFAAILRGEQATPRTASGQRPADQVGDDPVLSYRDAADELLDALRQPGAMERVVTVPMGTVPGIVALHLRMVEALVHGWDLARATEQQTAFPVDLVEQELAFTRGKLPDVRGDRRPFAPPQLVSDDASAIDRLAACLGRPVATGQASGGTIGI